MADYYTQRASAGLIISEGTPIDPLGVGYANVPGLWSKEQIEAWKPITAAVHTAGRPHLLADLARRPHLRSRASSTARLPVAPSAIAASGTVSLLRPQRPYPTPRALKLEEIKGIVEAFRRGAQNAQLAGFDGVELHGANGYLLDQFLQDGANQRTDEYGGPIENRARLMLECATPPSPSSAPAASACISPRAATPTASPTPTPPPPSLTSRRELGKRQHRLHRRPRTRRPRQHRPLPQTGSSAASSSPTRPSTSTPASNSSTKAKPTP